MQYVEKHFSWLAWLFILVSCPSVADIDIRLASKFNEVDDDLAYIATFDSCSRLATIEAGSVSSKSAFTNEVTNLDASKPDTCSIDFSITGAERFSPQINLTFIDGSTEIHSENFSSDAVPPTVSFQNVAIASSGETQALITTVNASDNIDLSYIAFSVIGLRASDIRAAGGVIAEARKLSFADSKGAVRVYPYSNDQTEFQYSLILDSMLSADEIAFNGVVLIEAYAVDASGNQTSISKIAFTGNDIQEEAIVEYVAVYGARSRDV